MKSLLPFMLSTVLMFSCQPDNAVQDGKTSVVRELQSGTVYKIEIKTNGSYYPHYLYMPRIQHGHTRLPVIYFCGAGAPDWILFGLGVATYLDEQITQANVPPFAVVAVSCLDYYADFEQTFTRALMPYLEDNFPLAGNRQSRGICGISAGGSLALYMAFKHKDTFAVLGLHSATLVGDDQDKVQSLLEIKEKAQQVRLFMDVGKSDILYEAYQKLLLKLASLTAKYVYSTPEGGHTTAYWKSQLPVYIEWYGAVLEKSVE
jgi:enterochelin esterase-like enzyme